MEEWRPIPGFDGYDVSSCGRVRSFWELVPRPGFGKGHASRIGSTPKIMAGFVDRDGYVRVTLRKAHGRQRQRVVSNLVLLAFVGPPEEGQLAAHWNGIRTENRLDNLRWATPLENSADMRRHGTVVHGARVNTAKLTPESAREVFLASGSLWSIGRQHGITAQAVRAIKSGKNWARVTQDLREVRS